jgi:hypothetical protein
MFRFRLRRLVRKIWNASRLRELAWILRGAQPPAPQSVKMSVLRRWSNPGDVWVETGTYLGDTTATLGKIGSAVISIEPEPTLAEMARKKFSRVQNVNIINQTSEDAFPEAVASVSGSVAFWLDGHYSAGITFLGEQETPVKSELQTIANQIERFDSVAVFVDDFRCFGASRSAIEPYPSREFLVNWAETNKLGWTVEHDIFVASSRLSSRVSD